MSQLVKLKQRLQTVETIRKITQAMRLVSMSIHSQLINQLSFLQNYQSELDKVFYISKSKTTNDEKLGTKSIENKSLIIVIGSQKGLCGSFSSTIATLANKTIQPNSKIEVLAVGKKLIDVLQRKQKIKKAIYKFSHTSLDEVTNNIFDYITQHNQFTNVTCISNYPKSFFHHTTKTTIVLPFEPPIQTKQPVVKISEEYTWEQPQKEIIDFLTQKQIKLKIRTILFESLVAEYAARFRSMDNATRNAEKLQETTQRQYNKLRQTKITKELVELSGIFQMK